MHHVSRTLLSSLAVVVLALPLSTVTAFAQDAASAPNGVLTGAVIEGSAKVVHIDPAANAVTLRGASGKTVVVDVDPSVGDVKKLKVGDQVNLAYKEALLLRADKVDSKGVRSRVDTTATVPASGGVTATAQSVQVVATVQKIDRKNRIVTLRGPRHTVALKAPDDVPLDKLKVGDSVRADYVAATALQVTRDGQPLH